MDQTARTKYAAAYYRCRPKHERCDDFSIRHPQMPTGKRAKIFSPFAALRGFDEAIDDKKKTYIDKIELNEEAQNVLNQKLVHLNELTRNLRIARENRVIASVTYYVPCSDEFHEAYGCRGSYETVKGIIWKVDPLLTRTLTVGDLEIEFSDISDIVIEEGA
jgi:hypothetical protein